MTNYSKSFKNHVWHFWGNFWTLNDDVVTLTVSTNSTSKTFVLLLRIHWRFKRFKKQAAKVYASDKIDDTKNAVFFLLQAPTHHSFTFNSDSYMSWSTRFVSLKRCVGFSIFDFISFLLKFIFLFNKIRELITPFKIKIIEKPHIV